MDCTLVREKLSCYMDGQVNRGEREAIRWHLRHCETCAHELSAIRLLTQSAHSITDVEPPRYLRRRIGLSTVAAPTSLGLRIEGRIRTALRPSSVRWSLVGSLAVASVVFSAIVTTHPTRQQDTPHASAPEVPPVVVRAAEPQEPQRVSFPLVRRHASPPIAAGVREDAIHTTRHIADREGEKSRQVRHLLVRKSKVSSVATAARRKPTIAAAVRRPSAGGDPMVASVAESEIGVSVDAGLWNREEEGNDNPDVKQSSMEIASSEFELGDQTNEEMVRSLKQQLRMQKRGDGISIDVIDVRF